MDTNTMQRLLQETILATLAPDVGEVALHDPATNEEVVANFRMHKGKVHVLVFQEVLENGVEKTHEVTIEISTKVIGEELA